MIIEIDNELFNQVKQLVKNRNQFLYEQLENIKPLENVSIDTLKNAREIKTQRVKESIRKTIKSLIIENINPTKYQVNKRTSIAYVTINKYFDEIVDEVKNG